MNPLQILLTQGKAFSVAFLWQFLVVPLPLLAGFLMQRVIDQVVTNDFMRFGLGLAAGLSVLEILTQRFLRLWYLAHYDLLAGVLERYRLNAFRTAFGNRRQTVGVLADRIQSDPDVLGQYPAELYKSVLRLAFSFVATIVLLRISVWLTVLTLIPLLLFVIGIRNAQERMVELQNHVAEKEAAVMTTVDEIIHNGSTILRHNGRGNALAHYTTLRNAAKAASVRAAHWQGVVQSAQGNLESLTAALVLLVSAGELNSGRLTLGQYVLFTIYLGWIAYAPMRLGELMAMRSSANAAKARLVGCVGEGSTEHSMIDTAQMPDHPTTDLTANLHITIDPLVQSRLPIRFEVAPRSITVVQGAVGTGKTRLLESLLGNGPGRVQVQYGGQLLNSLKAMSGFAPATPEFMDVSLRDNVILAREGNWDRAVTLSVLDNDVSIQPEGMLTNNTGLSGGQRARLAVARAAFDQAAVLVLDDPTAALDDETARHLWQRLRQSGLTVIVASNHPGAASIADQVIVLSRDGIGEGTMA